MGWFRKQGNPDDGTPTEGRPIGSSGNTGLLFSGWYAAASQTLLHASRDDDPRCQRVLCIEAKIAADWAKHFAKNERQTRMCERLTAAIVDLMEIARNTPALAVPHDHPFDQEN